MPDGSPNWNCCHGRFCGAATGAALSRSRRKMILPRTARDAATRRSSGSQAAPGAGRDGGRVTCGPCHCSAGSEEWTSDCTGPDSSTSCSRRLTGSGGTCCEPGSPESPSMTTYEAWDAFNHQATGEQTRSLRRSTGGGLHDTLLISSAAGSPAKTSPSPDNDAASPATDPACSSSSPGSQTLFDPDGFSSRTYPDCSPAMAVGTSESCLERWPTSGTAWRGGFSTHVTSECRSADGACTSSGVSLTEILEPPQSVPARYSLSARAATGILRRAEKRGRMLPSHLYRSLEAVALTTTTPRQAE